MSQIEKLYLSERNLRTLLSKLERHKLTPGSSKCTMVKMRNIEDPFVSTIYEVEVIAVSDEEYYKNRDPGEVHYLDDPDLRI